MTLLQPAKFFAGVLSMSTDARTLESAINEAESVAQHILADSQPVTISNGAALTLIKAAKQLIADGLWSKRCPKEEGVYAFRSDELDREPQAMTVFKRKGVLMVDDKDCGKLAVKDYHDGLMNPEWRKIC